MPSFVEIFPAFSLTYVPLQISDFVWISMVLIPIIVVIVTTAHFRGLGKTDEVDNTGGGVTGSTDDIIDEKDGRFPWLDYPERGWEVPCPACDQKVTNEFRAFKSHWQDSTDCPGPEAVADSTWHELGISDNIGTAQDFFDTPSKDSDTATDRSSSEGIELNKDTSFPFIGDSRESMRANCPSCGHMVHNTRDSFVSHWMNNPTCEGIPSEQPDGVSISESEWIELVNTVPEANRNQPADAHDSEKKEQAVVPAPIDTHLETVSKNLDTASKKRKSGEYDRALKACETARDAADRAHDLASENVPEQISKVETYIDRIEKLSNEIDDERQTHILITQTLSSLSDQVDTAAKRFDVDPEVTIANLDNIEKNLQDVATQLDDYEFTRETEEFERLRRRCEQLREQAENAQDDTRVPETTPSTRCQSLTYEDITKDDPLGSGGNADVYRVTATTGGEEIELAVKEPRMSGTLHTETIDRMLTEAETWQQLDAHDHIVSVVDYGSEPLPWIAMEYMDAGHIGERAEEMNFDQKLWTAIATTKAVRHAHRRGVAHQDLKPDNILFRSVEDAWDVPKIADWGLSKHLLKHSKSVEGMSPHYAAPEQFDEEFGSADDITDVYQLGAVFYELFTGRPPFEGRPTKVMRAAIGEEPTPPSKIADVPPELDDILLTSLAKEKKNRYDTVVYLRDKLQSLR